MVSAIFSTLGEVITGVLANLTNAAAGIGAMFWAEPTGTETSGHLTFLGIVSIFAVGAGVVYFVFRLVQSLIQRGAGRAS